jgi:HrpA-like RNA helicase
VDEVHERPEPTDFLLLALRKALVRRPDLKALIVSATMDPGFFEAYFRAAGLGVGVVDVEGATPKPIDVLWRPVPRGSEYISEATKHAVSYLNNPVDGRGSVLVFVPVSREATMGCRMTLDACKASRECDLEALLCRRLHAKVSPEESSEARKDAEDRPRVIFATNVAESSITIDDLKCVIDPGYEFDVRYDAGRDAYVSGRRRITRAQAMQRRGRVGRNQSGVCVHMYTREEFDALEDMPAPKVSTADLAERCWAMLTSPDGARDWLHVTGDLLNLPTPASAAQVDAARRVLTLYGLIDPGTRRLTHVGRNLSDLMSFMRGQVSLGSALLLMAGIRCGCAEDAAILAGIEEATKGDTRELWKLRHVGGREVLLPPAGLPEDGASEHKRLIACYGWLFKRKASTAGEKKTAAAVREGVFEPAWRDVHAFVTATAPRLARFEFRRRESFDRGPGFWRYIPEGGGLGSALLAARMRHLCVCGAGPGGSRAARALLSDGVFDLPPGLRASPGDVVVCDRLVYRDGSNPVCETVSVFSATRRQSAAFVRNVIASYNSSRSSSYSSQPS